MVVRYLFIFAKCRFFVLCRKWIRFIIEESVIVYDVEIEKYYDMDMAEKIK